MYLRYYLNGIAVMVSTGVSIKPEDWNSKREMVRATHVFCGRLNYKLRKQRNEVDRLIAGHTGHLTATMLRQMMSGKYLTQDDVANEKNRDFIEYAFDYNKTCYELEKIAFSTYNNDNYNIELFRKYITRSTGESVLPFDEITVGTFDKYKEYCLGIGNKKASINKKLKPLFKAISYAAKNDIIPSRLAYNICDRYFDLRNRKYEPVVETDTVRYLTTGQMQELVNLYPRMRHDRTRDYVDMFLFSYYACGLRFSDLMTLEWRHIDWEKKQIRKNLYKEKVRHHIPINNAAMEILKRWGAMRINDRFVFNLLPESFDLNDVVLLDKLRKNKNRALRISLQEVGYKLKLPFSLSIHVARHTFAVMALNRGMPTHVLCKLLGHKSITSTEKYYAKFLHPHLAEEVRSKMNFDFRPQPSDAIGSASLT